MRYLILTVLSAFLLAACSSSKVAESDPMARLAKVDISETIINPDTLVLFEARYENDKPVERYVVKSPRPDVLGFIGDFDRFRIKFHKVEKCADRMYSVRGVWCRYGEHVEQFKGSIYIDSVKAISDSAIYGAPEYERLINLTESGTIFATADFSDYQGNKWKGKAAYNYEVVDGQYYYSTITAACDGYSNNPYEGVMTTSKGEELVCNWGDFRIPGSGGHDSGCGMFSPRGGRGWEDYAMIVADSLLYELDCEWETCLRSTAATTITKRFSKRRITNSFTASSSLHQSVGLWCRPTTSNTNSSGMKEPTTPKRATASKLQDMACSTRP